MLYQKWVEEKNRIEAAPRVVRGVSPALIAFNKECPAEARTALAADRTSKATQVRDAAPVATPIPAPAAPTARVKTPGYFVDWDNALTAQCDIRTPEGRTQCAQTKIDRAVAESRLSAGEVQACGPLAVSSPTSPDPDRDRRMRELQAQRMGSIGGDAYWKWTGKGGCQLAERVQQTFAAVAPPPTVKALAPGGADLSMCGIDASRPQCIAAMEIPRQSYRHFESRALSRCVEAGTQGKGRDYCVRSVIEQAVNARLLSSAAVEDCRAEWGRGSRGEMEYIEIYRCLSRMAHIEDASASIVVRTQTQPATAALRQDGYRRSDTLAAIYAGDWAHVPQRTDDGDYFLNALGMLDATCPDLGLETVWVQLGQIAVQNLRDTNTRIAGGQGTARDLATVLNLAGGILEDMEDCKQHLLNDTLYEACLAKKDAAFQLPQSADARADMGVMLKRHACGSPVTKRFAKSLSSWLVMPEHKRYAMSWSLELPKAAEYETIFQNCRRQAGEGAADAWCGCYAMKYSQAQPGTLASPVEVMAAVRASAFVGDETAWFTPPGLHDCSALREETLKWRTWALPSQVVTACLTQQGPAAKAIAPDVKACRYRTGWGEIEVRLAQCAPKLFAHQWCGEPVSCN
jgi:hypothetical protein